MDSIYLMGSEDVRNAANTIRNAAEEMRRAANEMSESLERNQRFMDDWLQRFQIPQELT
jgi:Sec-independent protein translocase protein TatA